MKHIKYISPTPERTPNLDQTPTPVPAPESENNATTVVIIVDSASAAVVTASGVTFFNGENKVITKKD